MITKEKIRKEMINYCYQNNLSLRALADSLNIPVSSLYMASSKSRKLSDKVILLLIKYWSKKKENLISKKYKKKRKKEFF